MPIKKTHCFPGVVRIFAGVLLAMGLALPASAYEGAGGTIQDVWMQHGGARLQYNALVRPRQVNTGGTAFSDPASLPLLQPLKPYPAQQPRKRSVRRSVKRSPASVVGAQSASSAATRDASGKSAALRPAPMPASTPAPSVGPTAAPATPQPMATPGTPAVPNR